MGTINGVPVGQAADDAIRQVVLSPGTVAQNYNFAELRGAGMTGVVTAEDEDDDGPLEVPVEGVAMILAGTDVLGRAVQLSARTDERGAYRFRIDRFSARIDPDGDGKIEKRSWKYQRLRRELLDVERRAVVELRNTGEISDEVMRRVERDLDLEVSRLDV